MEDNPSPPSALSLLGRTAQILALLVITGATLLGIGIAGTTWRFTTDMWSTASAGSSSPFTNMAVPTALALLVATAGGLAMYFSCRWQIVAASAAVPIALLGFLSFDNGDDIRVNLGPRMEHTDPFYERLMWMSETAPTSRLREFGPYRRYEWLKLPESSAQWPEFARQHREQILRSWEELKMGREWLDALRHTPCTGTWRVSLDAPSLSFGSARVLAHLVCTRALLLAEEGSRTEAIVAVDELLEALGKVQRSSPTLVTQMIASVLQDQAVKTLRLLLEGGDIPAGVRTHLVATLEASASVPERSHLAAEGEIEGVLAVMEKLAGTDAQAAAQVDLGGNWNAAVRHGGRLFFHPRRTITHVATTLRRAERAASDRASLAHFPEPSGPGGWEEFRNPIGHQIYGTTLPPMGKTIRRWWEMEDARLTLIAELNRTGAE